MGCDEKDSANVNTETIRTIFTRSTIIDFDIYNFVQKIKNLHDELRKKHNSKPLNYKNMELNDLAKTYAKELMLNKKKVKNKPNIYNGEILGENIIISDSKDQKKILDEWKKEGDNYDFENNKFSKDTCHFTQMIWKETKEVGIGFYPENDRKEDEKYCIVILYYPPGNILGKYKQNVTK